MKVSNDIFFAAVAEQLDAGQKVRITLAGTSMEPTLREGDTLTVVPAGRAPETGDVVLFRYGGTCLLHRVVAKDGDSYVMQGDNCYSREQCRREDIVGLLEAANGVMTDSDEWRRRSRRSLCRKGVRNCAIRWLGRKGRRQLRPWYFVLLAVLMWAPLNGLGVPLDNYVLGIRADHLLHASVFIPCALFLMDPFEKRRWAAWIAAVGVGLIAEGGQYLLPYRGFDVNDLVANVIGVTLGWLIIYLYLCKQKKTNKR